MFLREIWNFPCLNRFPRNPVHPLKLASSPLSPDRRQSDLLVLLTLIVTGLGIYSQTLHYPFISLDDPGYVLENAHVNHGLSWTSWKWAWTTLERSNWHPLTWLSLMLDAQLYGLNAGGYHLTNLLLHLANAALVYLWLRKATGALWPSALTAFFFVAHPLHVESVAWVTERKDVLSALFFFLTLLAYTRYVQRGEGRFYWLAVALYGVGLTAKPMLVTLSPLLLLLDYWPFERWGVVRWQRLLWEKGPFFLLAAASSVITVIAQRAEAMVPLGALPVKYRAASALLGYGGYLQKTLLPVNLGVYYPYWQGQSIVWPFVWLAGLVVVTIGAGLVWRKLPFLPVGWGWFLGMLVPVIGVVQVGGQAIADRYAYLPHVGLFIAVFWTGAAVWERWAAARIGLAVTAGGAAAACAVLSYHQTGYWRDSAALFEHTVSVVKPTPRLFHLLGDALVDTNQPGKALAIYRHLWRMGGLTEETAIPLSTLLLRDKNWPETIAVLRPWENRADTTPGLLNNLAYALENSGHTDEALAVYQRCVERFPDYALAHFGLAELLQARGDINAAVVQDMAGLSLRADWLPALNRLALDYAQSTDPQTQASALALAVHADEITGGRDISSLNVLAFAQAANGNWEQAMGTAAKVMETATQTGRATAEVDKYRAQLESYRQKRLPQ